MAPVQTTEDYYKVLELEQTASTESIKNSYKRLALKLHPDRNAKHDATQAFQLLGRAYETLKDATQRRAYDLIYPSITRTQFPNRTTNQPPASSNKQSQTPSEAAQVSALQRSKHERGVRWQTKKYAFDTSIFELQRSLRVLQQEIKDLNSLIAAEAAKEAQKNSWGAWLLSPIYKKPEDSEEMKDRKDREQQERRVERDMKERRLYKKETDLKKEQDLLKKAEEEIKAADMSDDRKIWVIEAKIRARMTREREERERETREREERARTREREERDRLERERMAKVWKQQQEEQQKRMREEREKREAAAKIRLEQMEKLRKRNQEAAEAWENKLREENIRETEQRRQKEKTSGRNRNVECNDYWSDTPSNCQHDGWWPKVQGRKNCPECNESWTYLLQCPGCTIQACPRCQSEIRPRLPRGAGRMRGRDARRARAPIPPPFYADWD
ncbi:hypothetical protein GQ44DRAFT_687427 [Phaeosphaeriaceae sp. PMI808]|nr:hypothetical protein GQ44DRAFT_687427 [Phaeosphaeriaceae sp. PMI808]